jgi:DNA-binding beta-propeller fold protein YncE
MRTSGVALLAIALVACGSENSVATSTTSSTPATGPRLARALPNCEGTITAIYAVHVESVNGGVSSDAVYCAAIGGVHNFNTRLLEWPVQHRRLLGADARSVIQIDGGGLDGSDSLGVFEPAGEDLRSLGTLDSFGVGNPGPVGSVMSPDGTQFALGADHKILVIDVQLGTGRTLATAGGDRWLMPLRWTAGGIYARRIGFEGMPDFGLVLVDPATGNVSAINDGTNNQLVISPDGRYRSSTTHVDLGDGPTVRYPWQNTIELTGPDGTTTRLASARDHWFLPLDVSNTGQVLFAADSQGGPVSDDMGFYLAQDGRVTMQLPSSFSGEWLQARFVDGSNALVAHLLGGTGSAETGLGLEVVQLCAAVASGCHVQTSGDAIYDGAWPTVVSNMVMLGQH